MIGKFQSVLGVPVTTDQKNKILEEIEKGLFSETENVRKGTKSGGKTIFVTTPNPEIVMAAMRDHRFLDILKRADLAIPDGIGTVWGVRETAETAEEKIEARGLRVIHGADFLPELVALAQKRSVPVALIGGKDGVALSSFECLQRRFHGLAGWSQELPELRIRENGEIEQRIATGWSEAESLISDLAERILQTGTAFVFVGLGAPKQEFLMDALREAITAGFPDGASSKKQTKTVRETGVLLMAVGGTFDFLSGRVPRAPEIVRSWHFEWAWRLFRQPWRFRRQLSLLAYITHILFY